VSHEVTEIRNNAGESRQVDLWTGCYTPRELRFLLSQCGFTINSISSVEPGVYVEAPPTVESPEFLVRATKDSTSLENGSGGGIVPLDW